MKIVRQYIGFIIAGILLFYLVKPFLQTHATLKPINFQIQWYWLFSSFCLIIFHLSAYLYPFAKMLSGVTQKNVRFRDAWMLFHLANITRYIPGRVWGIVRLLSLSKQFGLSKTDVGCSLALQVGIETFIGCIFAMSLFFSREMQGIVHEVVEKFAENTVIIIIVGIGIMVGFLISVLSSKVRQFTTIFRDIGMSLLQKSFWGSG